jgi:predicted enzyme involved in methoxymalonyl-ACP biosynthesis
MLSTAIHYAHALEVEEVYARYIPTSKNKPCFDFFKSIAPRFHQQGEFFIWNVEHPFPLPEHIELVQ